MTAASVWAALRNRDNQRARVSMKDGGSYTPIAEGTYNTNSGNRSWSGSGHGAFQAWINCSTSGPCANPAAGRAYFQVKDIKLTVDDAYEPTLNYVAGDLLAGGEVSGIRSYGFSATDFGAGPRSSVVKVNGTTTNAQTYACEIMDPPYNTTSRRLTACQTKAQQHAYLYDTASAPFQEGSNTVEVCVEDFGAGDIGNERCYSSQVTVDNSPPDTQIDSGPSGTVNETNAEFSFSSPDEPGSTFECRLDPPAGAWRSSCTSPWPEGSLADGEHTWQVRAKDEQGRVDPSPASRTWTVDTSAPQTTITRHPQAVTTDRSATFEFSSDAESVTFECSLAPAEPGWTPCGTPSDYQSLAVGSHAFRVRAVDVAGTPDPSPASWTFVVGGDDPPAVAPLGTCEFGADDAEDPDAAQTGTYSLFEPGPILGSTQAQVSASGACSGAYGGTYTEGERAEITLSGGSAPTGSCSNSHTQLSGTVSLPDVGISFGVTVHMTGFREALAPVIVEGGSGTTSGVLMAEDIGCGDSGEFYLYWGPVAPVDGPADEVEAQLSDADPTEPEGAPDPDIVYDAEGEIGGAPVPSIVADFLRTAYAAARSASSATPGTCSARGFRWFKTQRFHSKIYLRCGVPPDYISGGICLRRYRKGRRDDFVNGAESCDWRAIRLRLTSRSSCTHTARYVSTWCTPRSPPLVTRPRRASRPRSLTLGTDAGSWRRCTETTKTSSTRARPS